jgi:hypothetical protein
MSALFLVCLVGGLVATALLAMLGGIGNHLPGAGDGIHGQVAAGHAAAGSLPAHAYVLGHPVRHGQRAAGSHTGPAHVGDAEQSVGTSAEPGWSSLVLGWTLSWFSPLTLAAAALGFGGIGLIVNSFAPGLAVAGAILGALMGAAAVRALLPAFLRAETPALRVTAEAEAFQRRVAALNEQNQAAILDKALDGLPEIAGRLFEASGRFGNVTSIGAGQGEGVTGRLRRLNHPF